MENAAKSGKRNIFVSSAKELGTLHTVVFCGLMGGLSIILTMVASIKMGPYINIGFSWIPNRIVDFMFGPIVGMIYGGAMDIVKWMAKPDGDFMIIYTFVPMLTGIIVGTLLYKKPVSLVRIIIVQIIIKIFINAGLNTYLMSVTGGKAFMELLPLRLLKNVIMIPIDSMILFVVLTTVAGILPKLGLYKREP